MEDIMLTFVKDSKNVTLESLGIQLTGATLNPSGGAVVGNATLAFTSKLGSDRVVLARVRVPILESRFGGMYRVGSISGFRSTRTDQSGNTGNYVSTSWLDQGIHDLVIDAWLKAVNERVAAPAAQKAASASTDIQEERVETSSIVGDVNKEPELELNLA